MPSDQVTPGRRWSVCVRPSALDSHRSASQGSSSNVARLMRTSRPCVRASMMTRRLVARDDAVEGAWLAADRRHDLPAADGWRAS